MSRIAFSSNSYIYIYIYTHCIIFKLFIVGVMCSIFITMYWAFCRFRIAIKKEEEKKRRRKKRRRKKKKEFWPPPQKKKNCVYKETEDMSSAFIAEQVDHKILELLNSALLDLLLWISRVATLTFRLMIAPTSETHSNGRNMRVYNLYTCINIGSAF